jgi:hypothetical protein
MLAAALALSVWAIIAFLSAKEKYRSNHILDKTGLSGYYVFCSGNYRYFAKLGIKQKSILSKTISGLCVFHKSRGEYNGRSGRSN